MADPWDTVLDNRWLVPYLLGRAYPERSRDPAIRRLGGWDDACQIGLIGLYQAARRYDPQRGQFSTYAGRYIVFTVRRALCSAGLVVVPEHHGRGPENERLAHKAHAPRSLSRRHLRLIVPYCPLSDPGLSDLREAIEHLPDDEQEYLSHVLSGPCRRQTLTSVAMQTILGHLRALM